MGNCGSTDSHELLATNKRNNLVDWSTFSPLEVPMMSAKRDEVRILCTLCSRDLNRVFSASFAVDAM